MKDYAYDFVAHFKDGTKTEETHIFKSENEKIIEEPAALKFALKSFPQFGKAVRLEFRIWEINPFILAVPGKMFQADKNKIEATLKELS